MKKILLSSLLLTLSLTGFSRIVIIKNQGQTFSPATISITPGDTLTFEIFSSHDAVEVSEATYLASGNTALQGGFSTPFGGGTVYTKDWAVGNHYYVCQPHAAAGMKGMITVLAPTSLFGGKTSTSNTLTYPNPFSNKLSIEFTDADLITISNAVGLKISTVEVTKGQTKAEIDGTALISGVYYFSLYKNGVLLETKKVVKN